MKPQHIKLETCVSKYVAIYFLHPHSDVISLELCLITYPFNLLFKIFFFCTRSSYMLNQSEAEEVVYGGVGLRSPLFLATEQY